MTEPWADTVIFTDDPDYDRTAITDTFGPNMATGSAGTKLWGIDDGSTLPIVQIVRGAPGEANSQWVLRRLAEGVPLERVIWWHLRCNIAPPVTRAWVPYAVQALTHARFRSSTVRVPVELAAEYERFIQPDRPDQDNCVDVEVQSILTWLRLEFYA